MDGTQKNIPIEEKWETLMNLGFALNAGITKQDLLDNEDWKTIFEEDPFDEENPYESLYFALGDFFEREEDSIPLTNHLWHFDTECIDDPNAYTWIMENLSRLSRGELVLTDIESQVDFENETAWVAFTVNGDQYKWDLVVYNDWVDDLLFGELVELTDTYNTKGKYTILPGGQDMVIGYETPENLERICEVTGLDVTLMD